MNPRQRRFVEEYLIDMNATKAAIRAGYSKISAQSLAYRLLRRDDVKDAVQSAVLERSQRTQISADRVLQELALIAFADLRQVADWGPEGVLVKPADALDDKAARAIAEVSDSGSGASRRVRVKLHDKKAALESLAKHLGLYMDKVAYAEVSKDALPPLKVILNELQPSSQAD